jgi:hypothetical protein
MSDLTAIGALILSVYIVLGYKKPGLAFTTAPVTAFVLLYVALETEAPEILVLAPTLFVATLISVAV